WVSEADQRAAAGWSTRMPDRAQLEQPRSWASATPQHPYERIAADLAHRIESGELVAAPTAAALADMHGVSLATARRAVVLAMEWGVLLADGTARPRMAARGGPATEVHQASAPSLSNGAEEYWSVVVTGPDRFRCAPRTVKADITDPESFRAHLVGIVRAEEPGVSGRPECAWIGDYELRVSRQGAAEPSAILRLA
ncbi:MAG: integrase, partial [Actinomycetia bacterium]|nr:integrase [Actinomycetes bacterium]